MQGLGYLVSHGDTPTRQGEYHHIWLIAVVPKLSDQLSSSIPAILKHHGLQRNRAAAQKDPVRGGRR
ncbi:hypothetical protein GCM10008949_45630 [Deinococcus humi]|nr:hypothetical protein GCM10008949_45630 [Deinococcus humi]